MKRIKLTAKKRLAVIAAARALVDTPFLHRGRSERGIDCLGLVVVALASVGVTTADKRLYGRSPEPEGEELRRVIVEHFGEPTWSKDQPIETLKPGTLVTLQWHGRPNHVAFVGDYLLGGLSLIHADALVGRVVEHRLADPWPRRIVEGWLL